MNFNEDALLTIAAIVQHSAAMNVAALAGDFDEARFRVQLLVNAAHAAGIATIVLAAAPVVDHLGPLGTQPRAGYAQCMLALADALDDVGLPSV